MRAVLLGLPQDDAAFRRDLSRMYRSAPSRQTRSGSSGDSSVSGAPRASGEAAASEQKAKAKTADDVYREARQMWGFVPHFIRVFPKESVAGAWNQFKSLELSETEIPSKYKNLISLAVASQVPCTYCVQMDTRSAKAAGASDREIAEAVALAATTRHWSTVLNGNLVDASEFRRNTDQIIAHVKAEGEKKASASGATTNSPDAEAPADE